MFHNVFRLSKCLKLTFLIRLVIYDESKINLDVVNLSDRPRFAQSDCDKSASCALALIFDQEIDFQL